MLLSMRDCILSMNESSSTRRTLGRARGSIGGITVLLNSAGPRPRGRVSWKGGQISGMVYLSLQDEGVHRGQLGMEERQDCAQLLRPLVPCHLLEVGAEFS